MSDIDNKISRFENQNIEWKETWHDEYLKWINGYANAQGGRLYIGYDDNGNIVGMDSKTVKKLLVDLPNKITNKMYILPEVNLDDEEKGTIEIVVSKYENMVTLNGHAYYRYGSVMREFTDREYEKFYLKSVGLTWDAVACEDISPKQLDKTAIDLFREKAFKSGRMTMEQLDIPDELLLKKIGAVDKKGKVTRAGVIAFYGDPEEIIPGNYFRIAKIGLDNDIAYDDNTSGPLILQVDRMVELAYQKYMIGLYKIQSDLINRKHYIVYPDTFRELLLNACIHKEISRCIPVSIRVWNDRVSISNNGKMPPELNSTEKLYEAHESFPINTHLARIFYLAGMIEAWGSGFDKIRKDCERNNACLPEYHTDGNFIIMTCRTNDLYDELLDTAGIGRSLCDVSTAYLPSNQIRLMGKQKKVFQYIENNPGRSITELCQGLNMTRPQVKNALKELVAKEKIEHCGANKNGGYFIKQQ